MNQEEKPEAASSTAAEKGDASSKGDNMDALHSDGNAAAPNDNYYEVDYAKKDVISNIGDGEMHDEGLAGAEDDLADLSSGMQASPDDQAGAETFDADQ